MSILNLSRGDLVRKKTRGGKGAQWRGRICGDYSTELNNTGIAVVSLFEHGSVQVYPSHMLEPWPPTENEIKALVLLGVDLKDPTL